MCDYFYDLEDGKDCIFTSAKKETNPKGKYLIW